MFFCCADIPVVFGATTKQPSLGDSQLAHIHKGPGVKPVSRLPVQCLLESAGFPHVERLDDVLCSVAHSMKFTWKGHFMLESYVMQKSRILAWVLEISCLSLSCFMERNEQLNPLPPPPCVI